MSKGDALFRGALAVLAGLAAVSLVGRGAPSFVTWQLAHAHTRVTSAPRIELSLWSAEPMRARLFFDSRGTHVPMLPRRVAGRELLGVRHTLLFDRVAAHALYGDDERTTSVFFIRGAARVGSQHLTRTRDLSTGLFPLGSTVVGVVATTPGEVQAFAHAFSRLTVSLSPPAHDEGAHL